MRVKRPSSHSKDITQASKPFQQKQSGALALEVFFLFAPPWTYSGAPPGKPCKKASQTRPDMASNTFTAAFEQ
eukprot:1002898-Amphidinium_carterae.1